MLTRRHASALLARFATGEPPHELPALLGFREPPLPLEPAHPLLDGVPVVRAVVAGGADARRVIVLTLGAGHALRGALATLAHRLQQHAPHHRWLLLAATADGATGALAAWRAASGRPRISILAFAPARLLESDAESLMALQAASTGDDLLVHDRWCEILGREALSHRFYRALEQQVMALGEGADGRAPGEARRTIALLATSRLLFLAFLQGRGWLDGDADFLTRHVDRALASGRGVHRTVLEPLFFGTLNTPLRRRAAAARAFGRVPFLNGGLFARSPEERQYRTLRLRDADLGALFDAVFTRYRFSAHEQRGEWSERAIDPEMLGRAFESLMASRERRDSGSFYTPFSLVARVTDAALHQALAVAGGPGDLDAALRAPGELPGEVRRQLRASLAALRILDPACGSGAFLVHALERVAQLLADAGDPRPLAEVRRAVLTHSIFGVDVNPMAVWLCELRLWLSVVIDVETDDPMQVPPLPNLDRNVRVGDALSGGGWTDPPGDGPRDWHALWPDGGGGAAGGAEGSRGAPAAGAPRAMRTMAALRDRYVRATGPRKQSLARQLDRAERLHAIEDLARRLEASRQARHALVRAARGRDLFGQRRGSVGDEAGALLVLRGRVRAIRQAQQSLARGGALPFRFATHFADVAAQGGFSLVLGNPPWVRLHRIPADRREGWRRDFLTFRHAAWHAGAAAAGAGTGFAAQVDLAALFTERAAALLAPGGTLALLLPLKLWRSLAGGGVRRLLGDVLQLRRLEDWSEAPAAFDAAVYPSLVVASRARVAGVARGTGDARHAPALPCDASNASDTVQLTVHRRDLAIGWSAPRRLLAVDHSPGAPWLILPPPARAAFARLAKAGPMLAQSAFGRPALGVKCGCNDAFVVDCVEGGVLTARIASDGREQEVEAALLRPVLRGEHARHWSPRASRARILWTHDAAGRPLAALPPLAARWLARWRSALTKRTDLRGNRAWWALHRIEGAASDRPRVVWADVSRGPRACILPARSPVVPLNTCYVVTCRDDVDAAALAALLNSPLAAAWLDALAEPARGGFRRYLGWTVARLPIPDDWERARELLAPLGIRGVAGEVVAPDELLDAAIAAYRLRPSVARALVEWTWR